MSPSHPSACSPFSRVFNVVWTAIRERRRRRAAARAAGAADADAALSTPLLFGSDANGTNGVAAANGDGITANGGSSGGGSVHRSASLAWLDGAVAAAPTQRGGKTFTTRQVEEVKLVLRMLPIFGATILYWTGGFAPLRLLWLLRVGCFALAALCCFASCHWGVAMPVGASVLPCFSMSSLLPTPFAFPNSIHAGEAGSPAGGSAWREPLGSSLPSALQITWRRAVALPNWLLEQSASTHDDRRFASPFPAADGVVLCGAGGLHAARHCAAGRRHLHHPLRQPRVRACPCPACQVLRARPGLIPFPLSSEEAARRAASLSPPSTAALSLNPSNPSRRPLPCPPRPLPAPRPLPSLSPRRLINTLAIVVLIPLYDKLLVPAMRRMRRPITLLQRIGWGLVVCVASMGAAAWLEAYRLRLYREGCAAAGAGAGVGMGGAGAGAATGVGAGAAGALGHHPCAESVVDLDIWWQAPQYLLIGLSEVLTSIGQLEFFYDQAPDVMRSCSMALQLLSVCIGSYLSGAMVWAAAAVTTRLGARLQLPGCVRACLGVTPVVSLHADRGSTEYPGCPY